VSDIIRNYVTAVHHRRTPVNAKSIEASAMANRTAMPNYGRRSERYLGSARFAFSSAIRV
jgi:hypothetical protein